MAIPYTITGFGDSSTFIIPVDVSFGRILRLLSAIPGYGLIESKSWWYIDDYHCKFRIGEYCFEMDTPLSDFMLSAEETGYPPEVFGQIKGAFDAPESLWSRLF
jgi:hypothetical protein